MVFNIIKASTLVTIFLVSSVYASKFSCETLDTAACRTKFTKEFTDAFKTLHVNEIRKLLTTYVDLTTKVKDDLPKDSSYIQHIEEANAKVNTDVKKLIENTDEEKIFDLIKDGINDMDIEPGTNDEIEDLKNLFDKVDFKITLTGIFKELADEIGKLWKEYYDGLRPEDLKAYPAYNDVNVPMGKLRASTDSYRVRMEHFTDAAVILANEFDIPYFKQNIYLN